MHGPRLGQSLLIAVGYILVVLPVVLLLQWISISVLEKLGLPSENQAAVKLLADAKIVVDDHLSRRVCGCDCASGGGIYLSRYVVPFHQTTRSSPACVVGRECIICLHPFEHAHFVPLFALALALTWLYERTDNLLAPITAHALFNAANFSFCSGKFSTQQHE